MDPATPETSAPEHVSEGSSRDGTPVLLVEDTPFTRNLTKGILEKAGCSVDVACDGAEAVQQVGNRLPSRYSMILMDLKMPRMDGPAAARKIQRLSPETPIVGMSASASAENRKLCLNAGMRNLLEKPVSFADILGIIAASNGASGNRGSQAKSAGGIGPRAFENLPGIDARYALSRMDNDATAFAEALRDFHSYTDGLDAALEVALAKGDHDEAARLSHSISGAAAAISANALAAAANALESAIKAGPLSHSDERISAQFSLLRTVRTGIDGWCQEAGKAWRADLGPVPSDAAIDQLLDRLDLLLDTNDMDAAACFTSVADYYSTSPFSAGVEEWGKSIDRLDFKEARGHLRMLRTSIAGEER